MTVIEMYTHIYVLWTTELKYKTHDNYSIKVYCKCLCVKDTLNMKVILLSFLLGHPVFFYVVD